MPPSRAELHELVDQLRDAEIPVAQRILARLSREAIGPQFGESIRRGISQADAGDIVVCHDYDEMVEKLLGKE